MNTNTGTLLIASAVARHWARAVMEPHNACVKMEWRLTAHPLSCVRHALAGETDPRQLGVEEGRDARLIRRIALRYSGSTPDAESPREEAGV